MKGNAKRQKTEGNRKNPGGSGIAFRKKLWRILKPVVLYELCLVGATVLVGMVLMSFSTGGFLEENMFRTSVWSTALAGLVGIPLLWKEFRNDRNMFPEEKRLSVADGAAGILLTMCAGHLLNQFLNLIGFPAAFSGYSETAEQIYRGQNPVLLIVSVGLLTAVAEELAFRALVYRRAKDFWGTGWGMAVSALLFGLYHGNMVQFVYGTLMGLVLVLLYEKTGSLLAPILAHLAENVWGLFRSDLLLFLSSRFPAAPGLLAAAEGVVCLVTCWFLFFRNDERL